MPCVGQPLTRRGGLLAAPRGQPAAVVLSANASALPCRMTTSRRRPDADESGEGGLIEALYSPLRLPVMPLGPTGQEGDLLVIGGAEDKLGRRTVLKEFVARAGGSEARIAVVPTASSLGPEIVEVYDALFTRLGAAEVVRRTARDPRAGLRPGPGGRSSTRPPAIFMTGGNQLKLSTVIAGTPVRPGDPGRPRPRRHHRGHLGRRQHPVLAHGGLRTRRVHAQAADDPGRGGSRAWSRTASSTSTSPSATATAGC